MNNCMILYAKPALFFLKDRHVQLIVFLRWGGLGLAWLVLALRRVCRTWMPLWTCAIKTTWQEGCFGCRVLPWCCPKGARTTEVKILQPDSTFFKVLPGKGRKPDQTDNKAGWAEDGWTGDEEGWRNIWGKMGTWRVGSWKMVEHEYSSCQFQTSKNNQKQLLQYGLWFGQAAQVSSFFFFECMFCEWVELSRYQCSASSRGLKLEFWALFVCEMRVGTNHEDPTLSPTWNSQIQSSKVGARQILVLYKSRSENTI